MMNASNFWSVVLAGGEGSRLRDLTTDTHGVAIPKQFCSLFGTRSLLEQAIDRASHLVPHEQVCTIVTAGHRRWWSWDHSVKALPPQNVLVQPSNRGTGIGILYSLLQVLNRDPLAGVVLLPADHYVESEATLADALRAAIARVQSDPQRPVLLGLEPDEPDPELGYIVPGPADPAGGNEVCAFIEKPPAPQAREIMARGALWNTFIIVASARTLLHLFMPRFSTLVMEMQVILSRHVTSPRCDGMALIDLYGRLPVLDFSRDVLEGHRAPLCVMRVPSCGWNDLGTPRRVGQTVRRAARDDLRDVPSSSGYLNLAIQYRRLEASKLQTSEG